jgi:DUF4097 and DUF4098 domain-containing protein YvlB
MSIHRQFLLFGALASLAPHGAAGQSVERKIERLAESIAAKAERIAADVERQATRLATRIEREFSDRNRERDRSGKWKYERDDEEQQGIRSRVDTTIAFSSDGIVDLTLVSGDIIVTGWDRREARINAFSERGRLQLELGSSRLSVEVRSERDDWGRGRFGETKYELSVPRGVRIVTRSTSGDIVIRGTGGEVEAKSTSGTLTVEDAARRIELETVSGDIDGSRLRGTVNASSASGSVELRDLEGDAHLSSTSGDLMLTGAKSVDVELSTTSGEVSYEGSFDPNGRYEFSSHSGNIDLVVPEGINARFSLQTYSGSIDSAFPITLQPGTNSSRRARSFEFVVGTGGPRIIAESFSGDVEIRKRR